MTVNISRSLVCTFAILEVLCFIRWGFGDWSEQWFGCPERVRPLMDLGHRKQTFAQAALWPSVPGAGEGLGLEAVPHLLGGLEGAQSSLLAKGVLIAGPVPAADHRLRGKAVHVCDHPRLRPKPPTLDNIHPPLIYPGPKPPTPPPSCTTLSLWTSTLRWWDGGVTVQGVWETSPFAPKLSIGLPLSGMMGRRFGGFCNPQGTQSPLCLLLSLLLLFLSFLSLSQGVLLTCIDLPDKERLCTVLDYKI